MGDNERRFPHSNEYKSRPVGKIPTTKCIYVEAEEKMFFLKKKTRKRRALIVFQSKQSSQCLKFLFYKSIIIQF